MAQMTPELRAATDAAKQRIEVESYFPRSMNAGLKGNAQGFWAGTALGGATGAFGGLMIAGALALANIATFPLPAIVLGVAGIGATMGGATGARIGAGAGSIAGVAAERERRDRGEQLEKEILASPEKQREVIEAYRKNPVVEKNDTAKEILATTRHGKFKKFLDWPTFFTAVTVCAVVSMALFGGAFMLGGGAAAVATSGNAIASGLGGLGMKTMAGALAIGAGSGAAMGAAFGIAYPPIFAGLTKTVGDLLSGKLVRGKSNFPHTKTIHEMEQEAAQNRILSDGAVVQPTIAMSKTTDTPMAIPALQSAELPALQVSDVQAASRLAQAQKHLSA